MVRLIQYIMLRIKLKFQFDFLSWCWERLHTHEAVDIQLPVDTCSVGYDIIQWKSHALHMMHQCVHFIEFSCTDRHVFRGQCRPVKGQLSVLYRRPNDTVS